MESTRLPGGLLGDPSAPSVPLSGGDSAVLSSLMGVRRVVAGVGRALITLGVLILLFVALKPGDDIYISTRQGKFQYKVDHSMNVNPSDVAVLDPTTDNRLTLTTCTPRFSAAQRLIVVSKLIGPAFDAPPPQPTTVRVL